MLESGVRQLSEELKETEPWGGAGPVVKGFNHHRLSKPPTKIYVMRANPHRCVRALIFFFNLSALH